MSVYCTAPWNGLTIREDGHVRTCCQGQVSLGNLNTQSIESIENGKVLADLKQSMLSGVPDVKNCQECISQESNKGIASLRQYYLKQYPTVDKLKLQLLDIRWNNICNLGCMYCNSYFSSTWADRLNDVSRSSPIKSYQDDVLKWIIARSADVKEIMLVGGEPMLMKQNYALFKELPWATRFSIITNLSYDLENLPCISDLLDRPSENIIWNVSLENTGKQFEYVRSGGSWEQTKKNLKYISDRWPISINAVYSAFSAFTLVDTLKILFDLGVKKINLIPINYQPAVDIFQMPDTIKQHALKQLDEAYSWHQEQFPPEDREFFPINGYHELQKMLQTKTPLPITWDTFNQGIQKYDHWNTQKFCDLWPDVFDLMRAHLN